MPQWSVSIQAEGDRPVELDEVVALADAVAPMNGIASGVGAMAYGAQIVVEAESADAAVDLAIPMFAEAVATADLPWLYPQLAGAGVELVPQVFVERADPDGATITPIWGGEQRRIPADTIVLSMMRRPDDALYAALKAHGIQAARLGDCLAPREVDDVLMTHPAVAQAVAFAVPHAKLGEDVAAAIVLRDGQEANEREIRDHAASRLADFKVPKQILIMDEIPKGPTGKLQRIGMAEKLGLA